MIAVGPLARAGCALALLAVAGCGGGSSSSTASSSPTAPSSSTPAASTPVETADEEYIGTFASGTFTGTISLTAAVPINTATAESPRLQPRAVATARGTAKFAGANTQSVALTGTYDTTSKRFALSGGPWSVDATVADNAATGTVNTPVGAGGLAAMRSTAAEPATRYCGTFSGTESGKFTIIVSGHRDVVSGSRVNGVAAQDGEPGSFAVHGGVTGTGISLSWSWNDASGQGSGIADGTISPTTAGGAWHNTLGHSGTWSAGAC
jgi:hypothetical protein